MVKKGSWLSAIKRFFTCQSGNQLPIDPESNSSNEKKGDKKQKHGESNSFIPLFRKPSSVEKIFRDFEREQQLVAFRPPTPEIPTTPPYEPPRPASPKAPSPRIDSPREASPKISPPRVASPRACSSTVVNRHEEIIEKPKSTLRDHHSSAIKIQTAYRGYVARRSFKALKGLVRLQGVVQGNNVRRQTINAKKQMQMLVRVQSQIQSRRIQMIENQRQIQDQHNDKEVQSTIGMSEAGNPDDWDESSLTKEEKEARMQRKADAAIKRERAKAYAHSQSHQRATGKTSQDAQMENYPTGVPRWLKWLENQLPPSNTTDTHLNNPLPPPRPLTPPSDQKSTPQFQSANNRQHNLVMDGRDTPTPRSTRSTIFSNSKPAQSPRRVRTPQTTRSNFSNDSRSRASRPYSPFDVRLKDDDSLVSCPPYLSPHYMTPTVSAKAKVRARSNPRERFPATPRSESNRRQSFPLTQGIGSYRNKRSTLSPSSQTMIDDTQSLRSAGNLSISSTVSGPKRKPFNRFV